MDLIHPKMKGKHREYTDQDIEIIDTIVKLKQTGFSLQEIKMLFDWTQQTDQNKVLTKGEIENLFQVKKLFQLKYNQMIKREKQIKQIKEVLLNADNKIEQLLEKNNS